MTQLVKHLFREHKDLGSMKSGCGRTHYNPMWGNRVRRSLGTHCPPTCPTQWAPGQPETLIPPHKGPRSNTGGCSLPSTRMGKCTCVYTCSCTHMNTHAQTQIYLHYTLVKTSSSWNVEVCMRVELLVQINHTVFSGVCSELLWNGTSLYFVVECPYSRDNHEHSNRLISHLLWWHSLSDGGAEPSREPLCHIWESAYVSVCSPADNGGLLPLGQLLW